MPETLQKRFDKLPYHTRSWKENRFSFFIDTTRIWLRLFQLHAKLLRAVCGLTKETSLFWSEPYVKGWRCGMILVIFYTITLFSLQLHNFEGSHFRTWLDLKWNLVLRFWMELNVDSKVVRSILKAQSWTFEMEAQPFSFKNLEKITKTRFLLGLFQPSEFQTVIRGELCEE